jgi:hypothetical protein
MARVPAPARLARLEFSSYARGSKATRSEKLGRTDIAVGTK